MNFYTQGYYGALEKLGFKNLRALLPIINPKGIPINPATGMPFFSKPISRMEMRMAERAFGSGGGRPPFDPRFPVLKKV